MYNTHTFTLKNCMQFSLCCKVLRCQIFLQSEKYSGNVLTCFATLVFVFLFFWSSFFLNEDMAPLQWIITSTHLNSFPDVAATSPCRRTLPGGEQRCRFHKCQLPSKRCIRSLGCVGSHGSLLKPHMFCSPLRAVKKTGDKLSKMEEGSATFFLLARIFPGMTLLKIRDVSPNLAHWGHSYKNDSYI